MDTGDGPEWSAVEHHTVRFEHVTDCDYEAVLYHNVPKSREWYMGIDRVVGGPRDVKFELVEPAPPESEPFQYARPLRLKWVRMRPVYNSWRKLTARIKWLDDKPYTGGPVIINVFLAWLTDA
jgi:hypothetical protein